MRRILAVAIACILLAPLSASAVTIPTVLVGNPGNANDPLTGGLYGGVAYNYRIGTNEVTNAQYAEFLNAKAASDPFGLYSPFMGFAAGGITRNGSNGNYSYASTTGLGNRPVNYVTWYDIVRFANWMNNGQGNGDTETGAYTLSQLGPDGNPRPGVSTPRNPGAIWFIPNENEWYKAAYHKNDGVTNNYFLYPTSNDTIPAGFTHTDSKNAANYQPFFGVSDLTDVGTYAQTTSPYGAFDMAGNVYEWTEFALSDLSRIVRGGSAFNDPAFMTSDTRYSENVGQESRPVGFRIATVFNVWHHDNNPLDIDDDTRINALDALLIVNELNALGTHALELPALTTTSPPYYDASGDGLVSPLDLLLVINYLNAQRSQLSFGNVLATSATVPEPSTLGLAALGALGLLIAARRKR